MGGQADDRDVFSDSLALIAAAAQPSITGRTYPSN
jgi:hypothetical protein